MEVKGSRWIWKNICQWNWQGLLMSWTWARVVREMKDKNISQVLMDMLHVSTRGNIFSLTLRQINVLDSDTEVILKVHTPVFGHTRLGLGLPSGLILGRARPLCARLQPHPTTGSSAFRKLI